MTDRYPKCPLCKEKDKIYYLGTGMFNCYRCKRTFLKQVKKEVKKNNGR